MRKIFLFALSVLSTWGMTAKTVTGPVDYVSPLVGTQSKHSLSTGNTYPAISLPWGMNFWVPQTGKMGDGWAYTYDADKIRGFKQTHQPSPWTNDYGQFSIMPVTGKAVFDQDQRASWFSHKAETVTPYYYKVYLADHDVVTEIAPTERAAAFRFTFPENDHSYVVVDAFDNGSYVKVIPSENKIIGYTTKNSGGVPANFKNYFALVFDESYYGGVIHEIREMQIMNMGNYAHGNQSIQHMLYMYNYSGQPWKSQHWIREVMNKMYTPAPDGYCGDEDNGQTSAWYVFSSMGFYPVCPGTDQYVIGTPYFKQMKLHLENGKTVTISAPDNNDGKRYISSMTLNGKSYTKNYLTHKDLLNGSSVSFKMDTKPNKQRGLTVNDLPYSFSNELKKK